MIASVAGLYNHAMVECSSMTDVNGRNCNKPVWRGDSGASAVCWGGRTCVDTIGTRPLC